MPKSPGEHTDLNRFAAAIVTQPTDPYEGKNPAAVELGRLGGRKGGKARAEKLTPEDRSRIARKAAKARWNPNTSNIADQILARRRAIIVDLLNGPGGQELIRLDTAFFALTGEKPPSVLNVLNEARPGRKIGQMMNEDGVSPDGSEVLPEPVKATSQDLLVNSYRSV